MKKRFLCFAALFLLLPLCRTAALADAIAWDMEKAGYTVTVSAPDGVNFRAGPGTEYETLQSEPIPSGTKLYIEYVSGRWGETEYDGQIGWVALSQTTAAAAPSAAPAVTPVPAAPSAAPAETMQTAVSAPPAPSAAVPSAAASPNMEDPRPALFGGGSNTLIVGLLVLAVVLLAVVLILLIKKRTTTRNKK